jgi:hypothetical protein
MVVLAQATVPICGRAQLFGVVCTVFEPSLRIKTLGFTDFDLRQRLRAYYRRSQSAPHAKTSTPSRFSCQLKCNNQAEQ